MEGLGADLKATHEGKEDTCEGGRPEQLVAQHLRNHGSLRCWLIGIHHLVQGRIPKMPYAEDTPLLSQEIGQTWRWSSEMMDDEITYGSVH